MRKCPVGLCITPCEGPAARTKTTEPDIFICKFVGYKQELLARIHIFFLCIHTYIKVYTSAYINILVRRVAFGNDDVAFLRAFI